MRKSQKSPTVGRVSRWDEKVNRKNVTLARYPLTRYSLDLS